MSLEIDFEQLKKYQMQNRQCGRIIWELEYLRKISALHSGLYNSRIAEAIAWLSEVHQKRAMLTEDHVLRVEEMLKDLGDTCKSKKIICAGHAHLDVNWQWGWDETVAITLDTFKTVLGLMRQYPQFKFSQSQAALYRIVEKYSPAMVDDIRDRVREGRWEVTAGTWVEADKNIPNTESHIRQILHAKRYLSGLLGIDPGSLNIDFEPDTFGHSRYVPEILHCGGIKYYYLFRGYNGCDVFRWMAPSGNSVIAYKDPLSSMAYVDPAIALYASEVWHRNGIDTIVFSYGVGDHGGGPTRKDIERISDMMTWPLFPAIKFGTYGEFFSSIESSGIILPEVHEELNPIFTGCYSSASRIKTGNRMSEICLGEAEIFGAMNSVYGGEPVNEGGLERAWEKVLLNQFHDTLPGSGVVYTREHAMGLYQEAMADANHIRTEALRDVACRIDTSGLGQGNVCGADSISEGAGIGYGASDFKVWQYEPGCGKRRIFVLFNPSPFERKEAVELAIWEWDGALPKMIFRDADGKTVEHQLLDKSASNFWGYNCVRALIKAEVPPLGYRTYVMDEEAGDPAGYCLNNYTRTEDKDTYILENDYIKVTFSDKDASILSFIDKETGDDLADKNRAAGVFRVVLEDDVRRRTAYTGGRTMAVIHLTENVKIDPRIVTGDFQQGKIRQSFSYRMNYRSSKIKVTVSLDYDSARLNYDVSCDWREMGSPGEYIPRLDFFMPLAYPCVSYKYDVPAGVLSRQEKDMDMPANSLILGEREDGRKSLMLAAKTKHGFRGWENAMAVTLLRTSYDPDPYPEVGRHTFGFALFAADAAKNRDILQLSSRYNHPLSYVSTIPHPGFLPLAGSFMEMESGSAVLSTIKIPEDKKSEDQIIVRLFESEGRKSKVTLKFVREVSGAYFTDIHEDEIRARGNAVWDKNRVSFDIAPFSLCSICIRFRQNV